MKNHLENDLQSSPAKKSYLSPKLLEYGSIGKLTQNGQGSGSDGGGAMTMVCL